ncbi:unnamed protein product [Brachionus calyciflorus]|uniref:Uncharacterized protein n=1 Tax=Brachionus calyciflorus TaxID=104777 RepID=A0A813WHI3_9BILA|nr:unnamed protein product [Brachionus calyciflorus]
MTGTAFDTALIIAGDWKSGSNTDQSNLFKGIFNNDSKPYDAVLIKPFSTYNLPQNLNDSTRSESEQSETRLFRSQSNASTFKTLSINSPNPDGNYEQSNSSPNLLKFPSAFKPTRGNWIYSPVSHSSSQKIYKNVLDSTIPIEIEEKEEILYKGEKSYIANKSDFVDWKGPIPLDQYPINEDESPEIVIKKPEQKIEYEQEIAIRYLKPPTPAPHGDIIIQHEKIVVPPPAPPLVIRQQLQRSKTPEPMIIREAPPKPIRKLEPKIITIPAKKIPPPPRKVIIERMPPLPAKPQPIVVERWLPYKTPKRRVVYKKQEDVQIPEKPKNLIIQWETPNVVINRKYKDLGVVKANPDEYLTKYSRLVKSQEDMPDFVRSIRPPEGFTLASEVQEDDNYDLEGDLEALSLIDYEQIKENSQMRSSSRVINEIIEKYMCNLRNPNSDIGSIVREIIDKVKAKSSEIISFNEALVIIKSINEKLGIHSSDCEIENYLRSINLDKNSTLGLDNFKNYLFSKFTK